MAVSQQNVRVAVVGNVDSGAATFAAAPAFFAAARAPQPHRCAPGAAVFVAARSAAPPLRASAPRSLAGKSTLVGCLTTGLADDGRGLARSHVFGHKHELETGRTSAVATHLMGWAADAPLYPTKGGGGGAGGSARAATWQALGGKSERLVTFVDLCGHEKYLRTTIFGLTAHRPDYAMVIVAANNGVSKMTREHVGCCVALGIPLIIVVTKIDLAPPAIAAATQEQVARVLKQARKLPLPLATAAQTAAAAAAIAADRVTPVVTMSAVTGAGVSATANPEVAACRQAVCANTS